MSIDDRYMAEQDWKNARRKLLFQEVVCYIRECSVDLDSFEDVQSTLNLKQKIRRGLQEIPLSQIRGSVGRYNDFSSAFLPKKKHMRNRWIGVDLAMQKGRIPPIEVYKVGESYFVVDGNHRVSIARENGYETIEADVWEYPVALALDGEEVVSDELLELEQAAFLEKAGRANKAASSGIRFTRPGSYEELTRQIEIYRQGAEQKENREISFEETFPSWLDEVYLPAVQAIYRINFLDIFPGRTEADLFIWCWQNRRDLAVIEEG